MTLQKNIDKSETPDIVCFSHLRWGFVFQRPQHLLSRFARSGRVFFVEEPEYQPVADAGLTTSACPTTGVTVVKFVVPESLRGSNINPTLRNLLHNYLDTGKIRDYIAWFYTPMALDFADEITPRAIVYDCMDELSLFRGAPPRLCEAEDELLKRADIVFTGGASLYEAKRSRHENVYAFPSSVDVPHFIRARSGNSEYAEHGGIPTPRLGYAGVIDERIDMRLIAALAAHRSDWQIVMIGPVVKIDPDDLPDAPNIHWLGMKDYRELPEYFAGWQVGLLPFALNDATRFISPTKTPEYLSAGLQVVSTPIRDVVRPYGEQSLVRIAGNAADFVAACQECLLYPVPAKQCEQRDAFLSALSWDETWQSMNKLINHTLSSRSLAVKTPMLRGILREPAHV